MNMKTVAFALILMACSSSAFAVDLDGYTFLKISGSDARAVVKTPEGEKQLVSPGDSLGKLTIKEITADRVVLEQSGEHGMGVLIVTVKKGRQQISRLQKILVRENIIAVDQDVNSKQFSQ
jgi:type II secretory pathway component PulC